MRTPDGRRIAGPNPEGLSGSAVWKLVQGDVGGQRATTYRFAGVLTESWPSERCLIATRAIAVFEAIRAFRPELSSYIPKNPEMEVVSRWVGADATSGRP